MQMRTLVQAQTMLLSPRPRLSPVRFYLLGSLAIRALWRAFYLQMEAGTL
jgi:hypothetical protein